MRFNTLLLIGAMLCLFGTTSQAQDLYQRAVGLRLGYPASVSYKHFISETDALEGYVGFRNWGFGNFVNISGAYQRHQSLSSITDQLQWYYGAGASIYFWSYDDFFFEESYSSTSFGIQGYLGLDYTFENAPVSITLDWVPSFFVGGSLNIGTFGAGYGSLGVRYILD